MACSYAFLVDIGFGLGLEHLGVMHLDLKVWKNDETEVISTV
jgi:hypothetical protein